MYEFETLEDGFSALQRAEIAEIVGSSGCTSDDIRVSVLFNEPKLLKWKYINDRDEALDGFSALQRAEIAEIASQQRAVPRPHAFQCSSTSRNC